MLSTSSNQISSDTNSKMSSARDVDPEEQLEIVREVIDHSFVPEQERRSCTLGAEEVSDPDDRVSPRQLGAFLVYQSPRADEPTRDVDFNKADQLSLVMSYFDEKFDSMDRR